MTKFDQAQLEEISGIVGWANLRLEEFPEFSISVVVMIPQDTEPGRAVGHVVYDNQNNCFVFNVL